MKPVLVQRNDELTNPSAPPAAAGNRTPSVTDIEYTIGMITTPMVRIRQSHLAMLFGCIKVLLFLLALFMTKMFLMGKAAAEQKTTKPNTTLTLNR